LVNVKINPIQEIIIYELVPSELEDFIENHALSPQVGGGTAKWVYGILFIASSLPATKENVEERKNGIVHWESLQYTKMDTYQPTLSNKSKQGMLRVINMSNNKTVSDAIKQMKDNRIL